MLDMFFNPQAVAIIGASRTPGKLGYVVLRNVVEHGYQGAVYPINPKTEELMGLRCYPSVLDVPGPVDLAVVVLPSGSVAQALTECGQKGVTGAIIISAGFREVGGEGWQREREMAEIAGRYGLRLIGPNCLGIIDTISNLNASFAAGMPRRGGIAFMSQSGALCTSVLDMALAENVGFSRFVSLGNKADVEELALIKAWQQDPHTAVIMVYVEGIDQGVEFMQVARQASTEKPIIAIKSGTTTAGSRAVSSHTGTLAGSERAYDAAFRQSGVIRARSLEEMFDYSIAFARQPLLANDRIVIVTNAGGPGIMATDACEKAGLQLSSLAASTLHTLRTALPADASVLNPVDVLGDAPADLYRLTLETVIRDPHVGGVLVILTPQIMTEIPETARAVGELSRKSDKPIFACFMGQQRIQTGIDVLNQYAVPNYRVPERAVAAMAAMVEHRRWRERPPLAVETFEADQARVRAVFQQVRSEGRIAIGDVEAREVLQAYGFATPRTLLARDPDEAARFAGELGFPVALKIASPDILHKADVGGIKLNVMTPQDVRDAYKWMLYRAHRYVPEAEIWGCLVQEMIVGGREVIVSMVRDPHFGPLLAFGLGGIYADALPDFSYRVVPLDRRDARQMLNEIQGHNLLRGVGGEHPSDLAALVEAILRLAQLVTDFPEIVEFDIDPLTVHKEGQGVIGIDMRLVLA